MAGILESENKYSITGKRITFAADSKFPCMWCAGWEGLIPWCLWGFLWWVPSPASLDVTLMCLFALGRVVRRVELGWVWLKIGTIKT